MSSNIISSVPKLKGRENYEDWAFAVENFLVLEGMQDCIQKEGDVNDAKAKAKIVLTIDPVLYVHIKTESSAKGLWTKLKRMFDDTGFSRKIGLLRNLISIRRENCDSMSQYVTLIVETSQRLNNTGFKIGDEWIGSLLLAGLPEKFSPMIMAIEHSGITITADSIKSKLIDMEDGSDVSNIQSAFVSKNLQHWKKKNYESQQRSDTSKSKANVKCHKCKKFGHYKNQCTENTEMPKKSTNVKQSNAFSAVFLSTKFNNSDWYIDSGASMHMTSNKHWLNNQSKNHEVDEIVIADKTKIPVECCGDILITTVVNRNEYQIPVIGVLHVPSLATNLLSVSELIKKGNKVNFDNNQCVIRNQQNEIVATVDSVEGVYKLKIKEISCLLTSGNVWHRKFAHINRIDLEKMRNGAVIGLTYSDRPQASKTDCIVCCEGKQERLTFPNNGKRSQNLLEIVHADICGPMETKSIGGSRYFLLFVDDYSRMANVFFLKTKDEVFSCFKNYKSLVENQTGNNIKIFRTDNGLEFCSKEFDKYLQNAGILHQKTNPYTPEQNGLCERLNRTVVEKGKCLLFDADLPKKFWAEAVNTAVYLRNRSVASGLNNKTPFEIWTDSKPDVSNIRIFGSQVMVHIPKQKRLKWDKKAVQCILVGYPDNVKGYRIYNPASNTISTSRDIVVIQEGVNRNELPIVISEKEVVKSEATDLEVKPEAVEDTESWSLEETNDTLKQKKEEFVDASNDSIHVEDAREPVPEPETKRIRKKPDFYGYSGVCVSSESIDCGEMTIHEVLNGPESSQWKHAMEDELQSFDDNRAWEIVDMPVSGTVVQSKWVFKKKVDNDKSVRYRARLVAKGYSQRPGIDFDETFSPVLRHSTLRLLFALAIKLNLDVSHLDVKTAFLNGFLDETVYMKIPVGLKCNNRENKVLKLKKAIYGLKQSSRAWYKRVDDFLQKLNFNKSKLEPCLFTKIAGNVKVVIALYVDDFFVFSNCQSETDKLKMELSEIFKIKDLGYVKQCLGMRVNIDKNKGEITLDQENYIEQLLNKFNLFDCKPIETAIEPKLSVTISEVCNKSLPYQELLGSIMYLAVLTRPDIVFSVNYLSQFNNSYSEEHWAYAKRVLKYLKKTKSFRLRYTASGNSELKAFVDADWASNPIDRRIYRLFFYAI